MIYYAKSTKICFVHVIVKSTFIVRLHALHALKNNQKYGFMFQEHFSKIKISKRRRTSEKTSPEFRAINFQVRRTISFFLFFWSEGSLIPSTHAGTGASRAPNALLRIMLCEKNFLCDPFLSMQICTVLFYMKKFLVRVTKRYPSLNLFVCPLLLPSEHECIDILATTKTREE